MEPPVRAMMAALTRRGPDSEGLESWPNATLGHRRLAIIDLSPSGHQPILSENRETGVVFNGCIYNFLELRKELEHAGHAFDSHCDTEVLVRGYREWGIDGLAPRLHGMFAFAIWDEPNRKLTLVRDRLGVKPLMYAVRGGEIAFASTQVALRAAGWGGEIDPQAVLAYLEFGYVTEERSAFQDIHKLPPATILEWQCGKIRQRTYWSLPETEQPAKITFEEAVEETERLLVEAVRLRLYADVPIGALLSGGIDSALVCWAMAKLNANVKTFTVGTPGDPSDETAGARETARLLGLPQEVVTLPAENPGVLEELIDAYSEPFACQSALGMLLVSRAVKPLATVLLTGDGGDDVFLGYPFFANAWRAERLARTFPSGVTAMWQRASHWFPGRGRMRRTQNFLNYAAEGLGAFVRARDGLPYYQRHGILGERLEGRALAQRNIPGSPDSARHLLRDVFNFHRTTEFTSQFMPKVDGATMYYALEARAPFLDQKLWEFAAKLSPQVLLRHGRLKEVLREIVRRRIGRRVAARRKQGFTIPVERWLARRWSGALDELKGTTLLEREGWIRPGTLRRPIEEALARQWVPAQLWYLLVFELWLRRSCAKVGP